MEIRKKKIKNEWNLKGKIWTRFDSYLGITLKFSHNNLFLIKIDYLYTV